MRPVLSTCIYCHSRLGENDTIEHQPIGRRLAFDPKVGRLWVICIGCRGWNLTPFQSRWEALEECERAFQASRLRASTDNISLTFVNPLLELVRVGPAHRPEFALWRYGAKLRRRRWTSHVQALAQHTRFNLLWGSIVVAGGVLAAAVIPLFGVVPVSAGLLGAHWYADFKRAQWQRALQERVLTTVRIEDTDVPVTVGQARAVRFYLQDEWRVQIHRAQYLDISEAVGFMAQIMPFLNRFEASAQALKRALTLIQEVESPDDFYRQIPELGRRRGYRYSALSEYPRELRFALEMMAQEQFERRAIQENELRDLERAWREAERIAAIADNLLIPPWIEQELRRLKVAV